MGNAWNHFFDPEVHPLPSEVGTKGNFDPKLGFDGVRKQREIKTTAKEMRAMKLDKKHRDYCVDVVMPYIQCRADNWPFVQRCRNWKQAWETCQYEDYTFRMMEYERERRLLVRQRRIREKQEKEQAAAA